MPPRDRRKRNVAAAIRATRTGGKELAELTGDPKDASFVPGRLKAQDRLSDLKQGFKRLLGQE